MVVAILAVCQGCADMSKQGGELFHDFKLSRYHQEQIILGYYKHYQEKGQLAKDVGVLVEEGYLPEFSRIYSDRPAMFGRDIISYKASKFRLVGKGLRDIKRLRCMQESYLEEGKQAWRYSWNANVFAADLFFKDDPGHAEALGIYRERVGQY